MTELIPLKLEYCERVHEIAKECLPEYWSLDGIRDVLKYDNNIYYVAVEFESGMNGLNSDFEDYKNFSQVKVHNAIGEIVGFGGIMVIADEAELLNIAVKEEYRKCGIASMLLDKLLDSAEKLKAHRMLLEVREHNNEAQMLYKKYDFRIIGTRKNYYKSPTENAIIMEKFLTKNE